MYCFNKCKGFVNKAHAVT